MTVQVPGTVHKNGRGQRRLAPLAAAALITACCAAGTGARAQSPATTLSTLTPGETWTWDVTGQLTQAGGQTVPLSGSIFQNVQVLPFQGGTSLALVSTQTLTAGGQPLFGGGGPPAIFYFQQDPATHTLYVIADNQSPDGSTRVPLKPIIFAPGQWSLNTAYDETLSFPSGASERVYLNVTGTTTVTTPAGTFAAWIAPNGADDPSTGISRPGVDYWTPELGAPAAFQTATVFPAGNPTGIQSIQINASLTSASILGATAVPEPASLALLGCGLLGLAAARRRGA